MPDSPTISIIIPCYKQAHLLPIALRSILAQTYGKTEIIVIDDGSPDDVAAAVAPFGSRIRYIRQPNAGLSGARNTGIRNATGEFVVFLDSDDYLAEHALQRRIDAATGSGADVVVAGWRDVDPQDAVQKRSEAPHLRPDPFHAMLAANLAPCHCWMVRRSIFDAVGLFDTTLKSHEDWDMWFRIAGEGFTFARAAGDDAAYVHFPQSMSQHRGRMLQTGALVMSRHLGRHSHCNLCQRLRPQALDAMAYAGIKGYLARTIRMADFRAACKILQPVDPSFARRLITVAARRIAELLKSRRLLIWSRKILRLRPATLLSAASPLGD